MCRAACVLALTIAVAGETVSASTLTSARATVEILGDGACAVRMQFSVASGAATTVNHRLLVAETTTVGPVAVSGAEAGSAVRTGRTLVVPVEVVTGSTVYEARYRVEQPPGAGRCALLVPDAPTDGVGRVVQLEVALPAGVRRLPGEFPALAWTDTKGTVTLGHLPAFMTVPHAASDRQVSWRQSLDIRRTMDYTAVVILLGASSLWIVSKRHRR